MVDYSDVPTGIVDRVRAACAHLPEAVEERAFTGVRWRIRGRTLAHVLTVDGAEGSATIVTFHSSGEELDALVRVGHPFLAGWGPGLVAMVLTDDEQTDWDDLRDLLTDSYCLLAPKKLIRLLRPEEL